MSAGPEGGGAGAVTLVPVTLFDYGVGNLHSIRKALAGAGADVTVTKDAEDLLDADAIVLPGVGAFGACAKPLGPVRDALRGRLLSGVPCLAVCIGMQLLFEGSDEDPDAVGVGLFPERVLRFERSVGKVPHMGWNTVESVPASDVERAVGSEDSLLVADDAGVFSAASDGHVYYVHSYYVPADVPGVRLQTVYGVPFAAAMRRSNTWATQFHPEKSSSVGLALVKRWVGAVRRLVPDQDRVM